jgi:hypothetical protein
MDPEAGVVARPQSVHEFGSDLRGSWVPQDDPAWANTFIYLVAHPSKEQAEKNWNALYADPAFPPYHEQAAPLIEKAAEEYKVDEVYLAPNRLFGDEVGPGFCKVPIGAASLTHHTRVKWI